MSQPRQDWSSPAPSPPAPPPLTVIVAAPGGAPSSLPVLEALAAQHDGARLIGCVVLVSAPPAWTPSPPALGGRLLLVEAPPERGDPELWRVGLASSVGEGLATEYVAFLNASSLPRPEWAQAILAALGSGVDVVGGSVEPEADGGAIMEAPFLCDYGAFLPPLPERSSHDPPGLPALPGNNVAFRLETLRVVLANHPELGLRKSLLLPEVVRGGGCIRRAPAAAIRLRQTGSGFKQAFRGRFARGRVYSGLRSLRWSRWRRWVRALAAPALPFVLLGRLRRDLRGKPEAVSRFRRSFLGCFALLTAWSAGEVVGLLRGPGDVRRVS